MPGLQSISGICSSGEWQLRMGGVRQVQELDAGEIGARESVVDD